MSRMNFKDYYGFSRSRKLIIPTDFLPFDGKYFSEHWRMKKSGNYRLLDKYPIQNGVTNSGKNMILNVGFASGTQITAWYNGLIDNSGFSALSSNDTPGSHSGWTEFTSYSQSNRVTWTPTTSTAQLLTNGTLMTFDITLDGTLYGAFIISNNTKGGTSGTLWSTGAYPSPIPVSNGTDQIRNTYNLAV